MRGLSLALLLSAWIAHADTGAELAATCAACHRLDGHPAGIPSIVGMEAGRLGPMLQAFKAGAGDSHIMQTVSRSLSDQEIEAVARYLAALGPGGGPR